MALFHPDLRDAARDLLTGSRAAIVSLSPCDPAHLPTRALLSEGSFLLASLVTRFQADYYLQCELSLNSEHRLLRWLRTAIPRLLTEGDGRTGQPTLVNKVDIVLRSRRRMIFTFYSYKGGVGRSMALATVVDAFSPAAASRSCPSTSTSKRPGSEYDFFDSAGSLGRASERGLMDLIQTYRAALTDEAAFERAEFRQLNRFTSPTPERGLRGGSVRLMTAGRREPPAKEREYALPVRSFDWQDFFYNWKGDRFFDWLRRQWTDPERGYDVVLVDSRPA